MTYCHVAVSTADTSQQENFTDSHVILKALFKTAELWQRSFRSCRAMALKKTHCCGRPRSLRNQSVQTICSQQKASGAHQTAADTRPKHQPPFPFNLQENSILTQRVFKGFIVVWLAHMTFEASLEVLKVVDKVLHVSSRLQHF